MILSKVIISLDNLIIHFISVMIEMEEILENNIEDLDIKVSSVLNRQVSEYGKNFMFDGREDTCWNSDQGTPQWVRITFDSTKYITKLQLMFQGGFVGNREEREVLTRGFFERLGGAHGCCDMAVLPPGVVASSLDEFDGIIMGLVGRM